MLGVSVGRATVAALWSARRVAAALRGEPAGTALVQEPREPGGAFTRQSVTSRRT